MQRKEHKIEAKKFKKEIGIIIAYIRHFEMNTISFPVQLKKKNHRKSMDNVLKHMSM